MNQFEEPYMRMPFYLTYPMQNVYQTEKEYEQDMERIRELYPKRMKKLLAYVEEECDKMEYEGSMMYDEYPDPVMLYRVALNIYDKAMPIQQAQWQGGRDRDDRRDDRDRRRDDRDDRRDDRNRRRDDREDRRDDRDRRRDDRDDRDRRRDDRRGDGRDRDFLDVVQVLLFDEILRRRGRKRRCCRRWW